MTRCPKGCLGAALAFPWRPPAAAKTVSSQFSLLSVSLIAETGTLCAYLA
jgi:hypothetical protein